MSVPEPHSPVIALPSAPRMRYWKPAPGLAGLVSGYHLYAVLPAAGESISDVFQPAWPSLRFTFGDNGGFRVRQPGRAWQVVPECSLFGPSSRVTWAESGPGITVGIGLRPRGWARFVPAEASDWADRVGHPARLLAFDPGEMRKRLAACTDDEQVPAVFDDILGSAGCTERAGEDAIAAIETALLDPEVPTVSALASRIGVSSRTLERLSRRAFGFPPKLLMRRARFLRSLHAVAQAAVADRAAAIDAGYSDYSHFVRDAQDFLGMSPQAFLKLETPLLKQSLALRRSVLGAPAQALASDED